MEDNLLSITSKYPGCSNITTHRVCDHEIWIKISLRIFENARVQIYLRDTLDLIRAPFKGRPLSAKALFCPGTSDKNEHLSTCGLESTGGSRARACTVFVAD